MVDGGSSVDVCSLSTLQGMKINTDRIRPSNVHIRAFDSSARDTIGEINLTMTIGPVDFENVFQVVDMDTFYNFLLGRPWIHMARAVPSTLHQMVKFEHNRQEIIVHGEDESSIYKDPLIPCIEAKEGCESIVYQAFKVVSVDHVEEENPILHPRLSTTSIMVAAVIMRQGYEPGKGLGESLQGISELISLFGNRGTFGLGFRPTQADKNKAKHHKKHGWVFFVNAGFNNMTCMRNSRPDLKKLSNIEIMHQEVEYDEDEVVEEIKRELEQFENKPKPNLNETEPINIGSLEEIREMKISIHTEQKTRDALIQLLFEYRYVFAWSYDDMPVQQKQRKFETYVSDKIKEEIMKQLNANVIRAVRYTTWVANVVPVPKKDGKTRVCVDYRDLNKASPKDNFPLPNIHILVDNCAKHAIQSFVDCYAGYHQILMDEDDAEKIAFTTPWEIEVYVDDVIIKSKTQADHVCDLKRFFERLQRYDLKLNPAKCAFVVPYGKLLGFIVSRRGIELDPSKIKSIRDFPPPKNKKEVMSLLGRIKDYLSKPPVLVLLEPGRPLFLYLSVMDNSFGCVLEQHDATCKKEHAIYYLSKKFTNYEVKMDPLKYIFQKTIPTGRLAKWQILLTEFDIVYVTRTAMKAQALADHLAENPVDDEYRPLSTYFPDEEVNSIEEVVLDDHPVWKMYFDGVVNIKGVGIGEILISPIGHHYLATARLRFFCTNNMVEYEACIMGLKMAIDLDVHELLVMGDFDLIIRQAQG
ncbi:uncharacterized protein [Nicotiana sylvestris]|uniref:uncharacterized protein n=1 Tax=Nicotiana sylvestris TaxID=4096 RepID=UPI00388C9B49